MKNTHVAMATLFALAINCSDWAEALSEDGCSDVLFYSARNYSLEAVQTGTVVRIYNQYCENSNVKSGTKFDLGLDVIIEGVPIGFNLGSGSTEDRLKHFCKTFDSEYKSKEQYYKQTNEVVNETTNAWLACKSLASKGVLFRPHISTTQIIIEVARTDAFPQKVQGVTYDPKLLNCSAPNSDNSSGRVNVDQKTTKALDANYWAVTCNRIPEKTPTETKYSKVDISIGTTQGSFLLPVAAEAQFPYQFSSDIQKQIDSIRSATVRAVEKQQTAIDTLQNPKLVVIASQGAKPAGNARVNFGVTFKVPPTVVISPVWSAGGVGHVDTIISIDTTGFVVGSANVGSNFNWIARGELP